MISGIRVNDTCITEFNNMKIRKTCRWIIFVIENCEIIIHSKGDTTTLTELVKSIDQNDKIQCAYVVFDAVNKIHFFMYARESSNSRDRMTYASSKQALLKKIEGVNVLTSVIESAQDVADFK
ncbi:actin-depolymerizing factor 1, putative [Plasmodium knowlesi strain H]|uniref:Actin-depolymerizing factor 1, putative n=3 Tax=Plasmodium knowlesi TaxID=5850 RepID=A0A5K1UI50_PLAKH|nr:actin-depolymerizing factor 1, putative [Plasmodium knowlesi strain H]OTN66936.1 putative Actin depolymerizing factor [Plasmodium knowlesi]CAA9988806.1 actin-depolymerizing factor 1, putative [Plasmodium knowlesi strain H]SBO21790.1 actin-depolymerizing factor 1, putative [Plasmodium knowlesi strain H]SBO22170.1 actin-depolymerizing factor 1, putative [Plasmodium knowlesi strain H]VVS78280.1 actin-depolymerizing factor 1, putative [Plasmodium knowlesi strain H]|eukprot:XP_002259785.1 actin depolymerizing factor, putative [Plasmodium knowlesi strain H]